jgi:hypothetical protein
MNLKKLIELEAEAIEAQARNPHEQDDPSVATFPVTKKSSLDSQVINSMAEYAKYQQSPYPTTAIQTNPYTNTYPNTLGGIVQTPISAATPIGWQQAPHVSGNITLQNQEAFVEKSGDEVVIRLVVPGGPKIIANLTKEEAQKLAVQLIKVSRQED